jgi:hypothetical protein
LTQALLQSACAETIINGSTILVERGIDGWLQYDVHPAGHDRYHNWISADEEDALSDIYENDDDAIFEDGQLEQADWQPSQKRIDLTGCTCRGCYQFCLDYHILPHGMAWHQAAWLKSKWWVQELLWLLQTRWLLLSHRIRLARALRRLDGKSDEEPS